jgi:hypothetical protein
LLRLPRGVIGVSGADRVRFPSVRPQDTPQPFGMLLGMQEWILNMEAFGEEFARGHIPVGPVIVVMEGVSQVLISC